MTNNISMIELFSGIGAQERALRQLGIPYEITNTCDCDKDAVLSYAAMRYDLQKELTEYDFPSQDKMIQELQDKNIGFDFQKGKHTITSRTPIDKLKQYYLADKLSKNLGDISKVERLPYADIVTYSFPCTDLSVAGKGEGMVNKCEDCGYSWPIDFSNANETLVCPKCGAKVYSSTRSGLLGQVQRLLNVSKDENTLPKYLLLENVKNLVGKKFIEQFDAWIKWLDSIGYNTYYKVLNAKHYGIPQNRERVFAISIRKDVDTQGFIFPETITLTTRLKDMLENNVDEKYYLPDERIEKILDSAFMKNKKYMPSTNLSDEVRQIMNVMPGTNRDNPNQGRVYDVGGIAPTLTKMDGGNRQPFVVDEIKIIGNYMPSNHDASRVVDVDGIAPTVKENHGTVTAIAEPFVVASRGRNPDNPSDRTPGAPTEQRLEPNFSGCTNTLTSVQKDNYVCEPIVYDDYNSRISSDQTVINTLTTNCGAAAERNGVKIIEPIVCEERKDEGIRLFKDNCVGTLRTIDACGDKRVIEPELMIEDIVFPVMVRKYDVDCKLLCECLRNHKYMSDLSNKEIANTLNIPLTKVEHWFRQDECFAIPDADIWFKLKELLNITTNEFDESIMTFEIKEGVYDKANRCYHIEGIAPTLTAAGANEKIIEPSSEADIDLKCLNSKGGRNGVEGLQPSLSDRVYDSDGVATACTTSTYFMPGYLIGDDVRWRIRKLMPVECWKLMAFSKEDHDKAAQYVSNSALYKQAGNSIVVNCLVGLMCSLFVENGYKADEWTKYVLDFTN